MSLSKHEFVEVINKHQALLMSLCRAYYVGSEDQKDVFQDIVLQLWKSAGSFRGECKISTWMYKVGLNTILAKAKQDERKIEAGPIELAGLKAASPLADDDLELLTLVLQSLKGVDKAIIILYLEGYGNQEIAQLLHITVTNVSTRLCRVRAELKSKFKSQRNEPKHA